MLRLIPKHPQKVTANQIVQKLENEGFSVSKRTIERDLQALSDMFPILADERSKPFGWSWSADAPVIDLPSLSTSEALTLKLAEQYLSKLMPETMLQQLNPYFKAATKLLNSIEKESPLAKWPEKITVVSPSQPLLAPSIDLEVQQKIEQGLIYEQQLKLHYSSRGDTHPRVLTVHPLGIIIRGQVNYLCATIASYQDVVLLPMHRVSKAEILDEPSNRPLDFDLHVYANSGALGFLNKGQMKVKLRFSKEAGLHLYETPLSLDQKIKEEGDKLIVEATVTNNMQFEWWLNGFGSGVELLDSSPIKGIKQEV